MCDVKKVFAKKPGFLPEKETKFLILDKVELRGCDRTKNIEQYIKNANPVGLVYALE